MPSATFLGVLSLIWACIKLVVSNELVNKALDNWTKGTTNEIDNEVWKLLEKAAGMEDHNAKAAMLEDGLKAIQDKYDTAAEEGNVMLLKAPTKTWEPPSMDKIREILTGESTEVGMG